MSAEEDLVSQVHAASVPIFMTSKADLVEYYQDTKGKGWKQGLVHDLADITGMKPKNLERRFDPSRLHTTERANTRGQYVELGKRLPPIGLKPPPGGYVVTFRGLIRISKDCYPRHFERRIRGVDAQALAENPDFSIIFLAYFEEDLAEGYCGEPSITVEAAA